MSKLAQDVQRMVDTGLTGSIEDSNNNEGAEVKTAPRKRAPSPGKAREKKAPAPKKEKAPKAPKEPKVRKPRKVLTKAKQAALYVNTASGRAIVKKGIAMLLASDKLTADETAEAQTLMDRLKAREHLS